MAIPIWYADPNDKEILARNLRCIASGKKLLIYKNRPAARTGSFGMQLKHRVLEPLTRTNFSVLDYKLLWAFAERWHSETSSFHIPLGELAITLDDVQCLLHIPIEGKFLNHGKMSRDEVAGMVNSFLGVVMGHFAKMNRLHLRHSDVEAIYSENHRLADKAVAEGKSAHEIKLYRDRSIRAFLLFLVCCTIFSNKSNYYVDVVYLQYFQDLSAVREWNWGTASLVHLQHYLYDACLVTVNQMAGYMSFLQVT
ncbi:protein MAIN-LIKE 1-like [Trifolium pratense]|uniref:protein MAIN-LIKE 1-like n=1 Tax=Trifolium pratense TaxID=57577 RepID=UPI001E692D83|nr:protein MAIN-LIKE 1-like [Trifolium pratense]